MLAPAPRVNAPQSVPTPAGFWRRCGASTYDFVLLISILILGMMAFMPLKAIEEGMPEGSFLPCALGIVLFRSLWIAAVGATPGKLLASIRVVQDGSDRKPGFWIALKRELLGKLVSGVFMAGYAIVWYRDDRRGFHDLIARTRAIHEPKATAGPIRAALAVLPFTILLFAMAVAVYRNAAQVAAGGE